MSDAAVIADFNLRLAAETESLRLEPSTVAAGVAALLRDPARGIYFVAETNGHVVGQLMITYEWSDWRNGNLWWIQSVYVRAEYRRLGVFRKLYAWLENLAQSQPEVCGLRLYMHADNRRARKTYESLGMRPTHYVVYESDLRHSPPSPNHRAE